MLWHRAHRMSDADRLNDPLRSAMPSYAPLKCYFTATATGQPGSTKPGRATARCLGLAISNTSSEPLEASRGPLCGDRRTVASDVAIPPPNRYPAIDDG